MSFFLEKDCIVTFNYEAAPQRSFELVAIRN